jgi:hypothetical protein
MIERGEQHEQRYGTPIATRAQAAARQIGKLSRSSASAFGSFGRAALVRCLDPGYYPDAPKGAHEQRKKTTMEIKDCRCAMAAGSRWRISRERSPPAL